MNKKNNISIGNSGEYFVAGELERHGFTAALPMSNVSEFDILAINRQTHEQWAIQVKTSSNKSKEWILSKKNENIKADNIIYFLVSLNGFENPTYHIVPSEVVANDIKTSHEKWLKTTNRKGEKHNDSNIRKFKDKDETYLNNWKALNI